MTTYGLSDGGRVNSEFLIVMKSIYQATWGVPRRLAIISGLADGVRRSPAPDDYCVSNFFRKTFVFFSHF